MTLFLNQREYTISSRMHKPAAVSDCSKNTHDLDTSKLSMRHGLVAQKLRWYGE